MSSIPQNKENENAISDFATKFMKEFQIGKLDIVNITLHFFLKNVRSMQHSVMNHSIAVA